jgi:hypothetical protein
LLLVVNILLLVNSLLVVNSFQRCEATLRIHLQRSSSRKKNPKAQRHVPEELNPQRRCENVKYHRSFFILLKSYTYIPNERKCTLFSFKIQILKQLRHTDTILPSCFIWNYLLIRSNSNNLSCILFSPSTYLKPKYIFEKYEIKTL